MKVTKWVYILGTITTIITINTCHALSHPQTNNLQQERQTLEEILNAPSSYRDNTYRLLLAEIALQQNKPKEALKNYLEVIKASGEVKIAELALECAIKYKAFDEAIEISMLWADIAKNDINPQLIATTLLLDVLPERAKTYLAQAAYIEPKELDQYLLYTYKRLPEKSQNNLYLLLQQLVEEDPNNPYIYIAASQIAAQENHIKNAEHLVNQALKLKPELTHAIQLKAKLIRHHAKQDLPALKYLQQEITKYPNDEELKLFYSNALLDNDEITKAMPYLQNLVKSKNYGMEAQFILGEIYIGQQQYKKAYKIFLHVVDDSAFGFSAKYNLGQIAEQQNKIQEAIKWYTEVKEGQFHVIATLKAALLLASEGEQKQAINLIQNANPLTFIEQKQLLLVQSDLLVELKEAEQAMKLIDDALALIPYDVDFLYARSLIAGLLNMPEQAEQDLQTILSIDPEHANALNALGYTIANKPERTKEAINYLKKALELSPDNPAFMDSMGWVLFRAGEIQDSMALLKGAYNLSKDSEIAAHLGEVLWSTGKKEQAKKIWHKALQNTPNNNILLETLNRLNVQLDALVE